MSLAEIGICLLVAFLVLGPKRLPIAARFLGRTLARIQRVWENLRYDLLASEKNDPPRE